MKKKETGQVLIIALILLLVGSLVVVAVLHQSYSNLKYHQIIERKTIESYSADAGLQYALCELYNNPNLYADPASPLEVSFTINDRNVDVTAQYTDTGVYKITSTATSPSGRSTTIESYVSLSVGIFAFTIVSKEDMAIVNAAVNATDPGGANIHSNGNISLNSCEVNGDATAVKSITGWEKCVAGMTTYPSPPIQFPGDYSELYKTMAQKGNNYTEDPMLRGGTLEEPIGFGPAYVGADLTIGPNAFVRLTGTVYVTGEIHILPGTYLEGEENILAEQSITIEGGEYLSDRIPVVISTASDEAIYCAKGIINAVVYAPNGEIVITGDTYLYGAVGGKTVHIENATITYAKQLQGREDIPGGELCTITYRFK